MPLSATKVAYQLKPLKPTLKYFALSQHMALFGLIFLVVALILIGIGVAVGLVACVLTAVLLAIGVLSSSVVIGLLSGRAAVGIRAFLLQCGILTGIPAGAACAWLAQSFVETYGSGWPVLVYGALGGAFAGICVALFLDFISRRLQAWASGRLRLLNQAKPELEGT